jgi:hypothetical protein
MPHLTDDEIARIADAAATRAVDKALQKMYVEIGRGVLKKALWIIGMGVVALMIWLNSHGFK